MKKFSPLLLLLAMFSSLVYSQNYQAIRSTDIHYFGTADTNYILATKIDSVDFVAGDSVFYPFQSLRWNDTLTTSDCWQIKTSGWLGSKIIYKPDGTTLFFNKDLDTIFIHSQAALDSTFTLYTYSNGNTIEATVTDVSEEIFLGALDSVKTFTLNSNEPSFDLFTAEIKIGKNQGFISFYPWYSFPEYYVPINESSGENYDSEYSLIGKENPKTGITRPTNYDIYNLEIGDIIQYGQSGGGITYIEKEVISKTLYSNDIVQYEFLVNSQSKPMATPQFPNPTTSYSTYTQLETFNISDDYFSDYLPEELNYGASTSWKDKTLALSYSFDCGFIHRVHTLGAYLVDTTTQDCFMNWHGVVGSATAISGACSYYSYFNDIQNSISGGVGFISKTNNGIICGTPFVLDIKDEESEELPIQIYPNPTNSEVQIQLGQNFDIHIMNNLGEVIYSGRSEQNEIIYNMSELAPGVYYLHITTEDGMVVRKVVKQ